MSRPTSTTTTELQTLPPGLGLPSIDPYGLAVQCLFRFQFVGFRHALCRSDLVPVATVRGGGLTVGTTSASATSDSAGAASNSGASPPNAPDTSCGATATGSGFWGVFELLKANGFDVNGSLLTKHTPLAPAVELVATTLADAVVTLIVLDDGLRRALRSSGALNCSDSRRTFLDALQSSIACRVTGDHMTLVERQLVERGRSLSSVTRGGIGSRQASGGSGSHINEVELLVQVAEKSITSLRGLREMCSAATSSAPTTHRTASGGAVTTAMTQDDHFLATALPTSADCFAFAALSFLVHSDLTAATGTTLKRLRQFVYTSSPSLVTYTETLRARYFCPEVDNTGPKVLTYELRPVEVVPSGVSGQEVDVYRPGRLRTLLSTGVFAFFYFVVVNADTVVQLLGANVDAEDDGSAETVELVDATPSPTFTEGVPEAAPATSATPSS